LDLPDPVYKENFLKFAFTRNRFSGIKENEVFPATEKNNCNCECGYSVPEMTRQYKPCSSSVFTPLHFHCFLSLNTQKLHNNAMCVYWPFLVVITLNLYVETGIHGYDRSIIATRKNVQNAVCLNSKGF
jgi:hypothetical protein